jgi:hypothetical protein
MRLQLTGQARWLIFSAAQELGLRCHCDLYAPLEIEISGPLSGFQVWRLHLLHAAPVSAQRHWLQKCYGLSSSLDISRPRALEER